MYGSQPTLSSTQLRVFRPGLLHEWNVRVCIPPKRKEALVSSPCSCHVSCQRERSAELKSGHRSHRICGNNPGVIENLLKLYRGFGALVRGEISQPAHVN